MLLACFQIHDQLIEQLRDAIEPRDVGLRVFLVVDLVDVDQERRRLGMNAEHLVHRIIVEPELISLGVARGVEFKKFATEFRLRVEFLFRELTLQLRQILLRRFEIAFGRFVRNIVPLVVMRLDPERRLELRMSGDEFVENLVEEFIGPFRFGGDLFRAGVAAGRGRE